MKKIILSLASILTLNLTVLAADSPAVAPDNADKNERDRTGETKTPIDQSNTPEDLKTTQDIRKAVIAESSLSMTAKNIKIITASGVVTLRGPVDSLEEKAKIDSLAKANAGVAKVDNQLDVPTAK